MADFAKRAPRVQGAPAQEQPTKSRKAPPQSINTSLANEYRAFQGLPNNKTSPDKCLTASSIYSEESPVLEDPFADQPNYQEVPLPQIKMRDPAKSTPYPPFLQNTSSQPITAIPQPSPPYSAAASPLTRYLDQTIFKLSRPETQSISPVRSTGPSNRLKHLISALIPIDTSVAEDGPYNLDWELNEFTPITGRWELFFRPGQQFLANDLLGWWLRVPEYGTEWVYREREGEDDGDEEWNGWSTLPSPISPLFL